MPYASLSDLIDRYGEPLLLQHADRDRDGVADAAVIARALADADAEIDGWLAKRCPVPVDPPSPRLRALATEISWYRLHQDGVEEKTPARLAYTDAIAYLRRVSEGQADLPGAVGLVGSAPPSSASPGGARVAGAGRVFSRDRLRGL
jgi:phage gp36-like protein